MEWQKKDQKKKQVYSKQNVTIKQQVFKTVT